MNLEELRRKRAFICDMDGVIYHGSRLLPGVKDFVGWLQRERKKFLFLTNSSACTLLELSRKLSRLGLEVGEECFYSSARATASFLASQRPDRPDYVLDGVGDICLGE